MFPFLAAANLASGALSFFKGNAQKKEAERLAASNPYPTQEIPQAILDNQRLAQQYSNQGLPSAQYLQAKQNIARNGTNALRGANDRRGGLAAISSINQGANDATLKLDVADANAVRQNQQRLMQQNNTLGQWQNNVWDWNKRQKYLNTAASVRALLGAGNTNKNMGIDRGLSSAVEFGKYFSDKGAYTSPTNKNQGTLNSNVRYDQDGNEYYVDQDGNPIK